MVNWGNTRDNVRENKNKHCHFSKTSEKLDKVYSHTRRAPIFAYLNCNQICTATIRLLKKHFEKVNAFLLIGSDVEC